MKKLCLVTFNSGTNGSQIGFYFLWRFTLLLMSQRNFNTLKEFPSKKVIKHALESVKQSFCCYHILTRREAFPLYFAKFATFDIWKIGRWCTLCRLWKVAGSIHSSYPFLYILSSLTPFILSFMITMFALGMAVFCILASSGRQWCWQS